MNNKEKVINKLNGENWKLIGKVGVDSGTLMIADSCYLEGDGWTEKDVDKEVMGMDLFKQIKNDIGAFKGVVFSSGFGDGVYEVWANIKDYGDKGFGGRRIKEVKICLIDD